MTGFGAGCLFCRHPEARWVMHARATQHHFAAGRLESWALRDRSRRGLINNGSGGRRGSSGLGQLGRLGRLPKAAFCEA